MRKWNQESKYHWRCQPWSIALCFIDGCSMYVLSKDGEEKATLYTDEFDIAKQKAREIENGKD